MNAGVASDSPKAKLIPPNETVLLANLLFAMLPCNISFVTPNALIFRLSLFISILLSSTFTDKVDDSPNAIVSLVDDIPDPALTVISLNTNFVISIDPANILFVILAVSPSDISLPELAVGIVIVILEFHISLSGLNVILFEPPLEDS